ncbi:MAG: FMN-binding protein [Clostridia bacterium]|nr:FMN-binding protein [Clostridia bacterium]
MENKKLQSTEILENAPEVSTPAVDEMEFIPAEAAEAVIENEKTPEPAKIKENENAAEEKKEEPSGSVETEEAEDAEDAEENTSPAYLFKLVAVLTLICTCVALLLAVVNSITADKIAENAANEQQKAILAIFPEGDETKEYINEAGDTAYIVYREGAPIGYCVNSAGSGFGGDVNVMVGMDLTGAVCGLKIVSMSETPGIGTKVQSDSFLSQFVGQSGSAEADIISGATFSSRAVSEAVDKALAVEIDVYEITENENAARAARMMQ